MAEFPPIIHYEKNGIGLVFDLRRGTADPVFIGRSLPANEDLTAYCDAMRRGRHASQADNPAPRSILPHTGWGHDSTPAVVVHRGGTALALQMILVDAVQTPDGLDFVHVDQVNGIRVDVRWHVAASRLLRSEVCLTNTGAIPAGLVELASIALPLPSWASHMTRYSGRWAAEMQQRRVPIDQGETGSASFGGRPGFGGGNWVRIESAQLGEHHGQAIAAHLAWSGDHQLKFVRNADGDAMLIMAARLDLGEITLEPGESWTTPQALLAVSDQGLAPLRHAFHRHATVETIPQSTVTAPRRVHINSWEALGFDQDMPKLTALADSAAAIGVERFVLDDGWFKGRRDDTSSLGDWFPDPGIFPEGLSPLIRHVRQLGMDFGLWVEPEMVSPDSYLYRGHPDWCLHVPGQPRPTQRNQLVLDLTRSEVGNYLFARLDDLLGNNDIAYLKWDHNRELFPLAGKGHAQVQALYALLDRLRAAHPNVEIETCASGGGRVDFEILRRCARFWASDNNDAIERLRINAGWFDFLPLRITGNHVGPSPNPITGRRLSMDFRAKVAMFGHMGVEADPAVMTVSERSILAAHIALYKQWRQVLHDGELTKISTGLDGIYGWLALAGHKGLALIAQTLQTSPYDAPHVRFAGLDPVMSYRVTLLAPWPARAAQSLANADLFRTGLILSGHVLAQHGISLPLACPETAWLVAFEQTGLA